MEYCGEGCGLHWLGDGVSAMRVGDPKNCDARCNNTQCGFDGYDCPIRSITSHPLPLHGECVGLAAKDYNAVDANCAREFVQRTFHAVEEPFCLSRLYSPVVMETPFVDIDLQFVFRMKVNSIQHVTVMENSRFFSSLES